MVPVAWAAMPMRPPSSAESAMASPWPMLPSRASSGSSTPSKASETVDEQRSPIFSSWRPTLKPCIPGCSRKAVMARPSPSAGSVRAQTTTTPATSPLVIHCLAPSSTQRSPRRTARVESAEGSLPAPGSERPKAPARYSPEASLGRWRSFCSGEPYRAMISATMLVTPTITATEASTAASSIIESADGDRAGLGAAVLGRHVDRQQPQLAESTDELDRELLGAVVLLHHRRDPVARVGPRGGRHGGLDFGRLQRHRGLPATPLSP